MDQFTCLYQVSHENMFNKNTEDYLKQTVGGIWTCDGMLSTILFFKERNLQFIYIDLINACID